MTEPVMSAAKHTSHLRSTLLVTAVLIAAAASITIPGSAAEVAHVIPVPLLTSRPHRACRQPRRRQC